MRFIPLFLIIAELYQSVNCAQKSSNSEDKGVTESANYLCEELGFKYTSTFLKSEEEKKNNKLFEDCKAEALSYFQLKGIADKKYIRYYTTICATSKMIPEMTCAKMLNHLKDFGYDIDSATEFLKGYKRKDDVDIVNRYSCMKMNYNLWDKLRKVDNLHIDKCVIDLFDEYAEQNTKAFDLFIAWWESKNGGKKINKCDCKIIFSLYRIYKSRSVNEDVKILHDYFDSVCAIDFADRDGWNDINLSCLQNGELPLDGATLKRFLIDGAAIAKRRWCCKGLQHTSWRFDSIRKIINLKADSVDLAGVKLVVKLLYEKYTPREYLELRNIFSTNREDFENLECMNNILDVAYAPVGIKPEVFGVKMRDKNVWIGSYKRTFGSHLKFLIKIFNRNQKSASCDEFIAFLTQFKSIICQKDWDESMIESHLEEFAKKGTDAVNTLQCLRFAQDVEDKILETFKMLTSQDEGFKYYELYYSYGFTDYFFEMRKSLFGKPPDELNKICSNEDPKLNSKTKEGIVNLLRDIKR